jgi:exodeoxyribonuclease VII small subunit
MAEDLNFEDALKELENIVRSMEGGQSKLEDSLKSYEKGIKLAGVCEKRLKEAKTKLEKIAVSPSGAVQKEEA